MNLFNVHHTIKIPPYATYFYVQTYHVSQPDLVTGPVLIIACVCQVAVRGPFLITSDYSFQKTSVFKTAEQLLTYVFPDIGIGCQMGNSWSSS